nr:ARMT1-like domain-containing protein [uncultured Pseudodesulfovibrio sp.]
MNTALDCMPCFMKMAVREARLACPDDIALQHDIVMSWGKTLAELDLNDPPPAIARHLAELVRTKTGCGDLYRDDKDEANKCVAALLPDLEARIAQEIKREDGDALALALELAIIGNYIDRGVEIEFDLEREIANVAGTISPEVLATLKRDVFPGAKVLILGDNTGEIVLDKLLVKEFIRIGCDVTFAVRSHPVINDATIEDAVTVGMTQLCQVVESGVDTPGTILDRCSPEFLKTMEQADVILAKGQGNFESLEGRWPGIYCAFKVKCKRVAERTGLDFGASAFYLTKQDEMDGGDGGVPNACSD